MTVVVLTGLAIGEGSGGFSLEIRKTMSLCRNHDLLSFTDDGDCRICRLESIAELLDDAGREISQVLECDPQDAIADMQGLGIDPGLTNRGLAAIEDIKKAQYTFRLIRTRVSKIAKEEIEA